MNEPSLTMDNMYDPEDKIKELISDLFHPDLIFTQETLNELDENSFDQYNDKVAAVILYAGFSVRDGAARNIQLIAPLWRVLVVTPSELYKDVAGVKLIEVIKTIKGAKLYPDSAKELKLETDVREFNEPDFVTNMCSLPAVFSFDVTI